jgi:hypothetical protein
MAGKRKSSRSISSKYASARAGDDHTLMIDV